MNVLDKITALRAALHHHNHKYYVENAPEISDFEFDKMMRELIDLEAEHPEYADENSPYNVGDKYTWIAGEHCLVLVGYDYYRYYFNDPYKDHGIIGYDRKVVEQRYKELGNMAVVILDK